MPKWKTKPLRAFLRLSRSALQKTLIASIEQKFAAFRPDFFIVYKGIFIPPGLIKEIKNQGCMTVNIYPDCSPLVFGNELRESLGEYDLVVSTKVWHPDSWAVRFGYQNKCRFIPHGYDPYLHLRCEPSTSQPFDVGMIATYRKEYHDLIQGLSSKKSLSNLKFMLAGYGWEAIKTQLPSNWFVLPAVHGQPYIELLRQVKICIAPVTRDVVIDGQKYPGDEDTTRSYELPAAWCFFIHQRTQYASEIFDENCEVPMFDSIDELEEHILKAIKDQAWRQALANSAHNRSVPRDSLDSRVEKFCRVLSDEQLI